MSLHPLSKRLLKQTIITFSLFCLIFSSHLKALHAAECTDCLLIDKEDQRRTQIATVVTGATLLALVGGVAYLAFGNSSHHHNHHDSHYSPSVSSNPEYAYSYESAYSGNGSTSYSQDYSAYFSNDYDRSSDYSFNGNDEAKWDGGVGPGHHNVNDDPIAGGEIRERSHHRARKLSSKNDVQVTGTFTAHAIPTLNGQGSFTPFVQLPDGTTDTLGSIPLSRSGGSSLPYGPYTQKGTYAFGIHIEDETGLPSQAKLGTVEINLNGSKVLCEDFSPHSRQLIHYTTSAQ